MRLVAHYTCEEACALIVEALDAKDSAKRHQAMAFVDPIAAIVRFEVDVTDRRPGDPKR